MTGNGLTDLLRGIWVQGQMVAFRPLEQRIVEQVQPGLCFFENVSGHLGLGFDQVVRDLGQLGYEVTAGLFTAEEVGLSHQRERLFILAALGDANGRLSDPRGGPSRSEKETRRRGSLSGDSDRESVGNTRGTGTRTRPKSNRGDGHFGRR